MQLVRNKGSSLMYVFPVIDGKFFSMIIGVAIVQKASAMQFAPDFGFSHVAVSLVLDEFVDFVPVAVMSVADLLVAPSSMHCLGVAYHCFHVEELNRAYYLSLHTVGAPSAWKVPYYHKTPHPHEKVRWDNHTVFHVAGSVAHTRTEAHHSFLHLQYCSQIFAGALVVNYFVVVEVATVVAVDIAAAAAAF